MLCAREETFGPLGPVFRFRTEREGIAATNDTEFGPASYFQNAYGAYVGFRLLYQRKNQTAVIDDGKMTDGIKFICGMYTHSAEGEVKYNEDIAAPSRSPQQPITTG